MEHQPDPIRTECRSEGRRQRTVMLMAGIALLLGAWAAMWVGNHRVSSLDWTGYDPDPDISQSLRNDARRAHTYLPLGVSAVLMDVGACIAAIAVCARPGRLWFGVTLLLASVGSLGWHGFVALSAAFFAAA